MNHDEDECEQTLAEAEQYAADIEETDRSLGREIDGRVARNLNQRLREFRAYSTAEY